MWAWFTDMDVQSISNGLAMELARVKWEMSVKCWGMDSHGQVSGPNASTDVYGPGCGNGVVEPPEQCDDGNNDDGDGCAADCTMEHDVPAATSTGVLLLALILGGVAMYFAPRRPTT